MPESTSNSALRPLKEELGEIADIGRAISVLNWDQLTQMPPEGAAGRAEALATLHGIFHARFTSGKLGNLLSQAENVVSHLDPDSDAYNLVRVVRRDYDRQIRVPGELVTDYARTSALANSVWETARQENDYLTFAPWLRRIIELSRQLVEYLGYKDHPFDALIDQAEPGMTTAAVREIFAKLQPELVGLVQEIASRRDTVDTGPLHRQYDELVQERLCRDVSAQIGYDYRRGRIDRTTHPFEISFGRNDVRITTRFDEHFLPMALMGTIHEAGHGLYEQGIGATLNRTLLDRGVSAGVHESQSRLWENHVCRGLPFWQFYYPTLQAAFPQALDNVELHAFYRAINAVRPSMIRVEADEVTYGLHIMLRFELEIALFDGRVSVEDAPEAWNTAMCENLGITPVTDREGILQDVHWTSGFGGFQGYALGNIIAAQLWEAVNQAHQDLAEQLRQGNFATLLGWLRTNVHQHGRKFDPPVLVQRATGSPLSIEPYVRYLRGKFGEIYGL